MAFGSSLSLTPQNLSLPEFSACEFNAEQSLQRYIAEQRTYKKYYSAKGLTDFGTCNSIFASSRDPYPNRVTPPMHDIGAAERAVAAGAFASPLLVPRATRASHALDVAKTADHLSISREGPPEGTCLQSRTKENHSKRTAVSTKKASPKKDLGKDQHLDEHENRLAERRERRKAKKAILAPPPLASSKPPSISSPYSPSHNPNSHPDKASAKYLHSLPSKIKHIKSKLRPRSNEGNNREASEDGKNLNLKRSKKALTPGIALMQNFAAKNIGKDRITLKPVSKIGVFNRGVASARTEVKKGDKVHTKNFNVFSELTFLSKTLKPTIASSSDNEDGNHHNSLLPLSPQDDRLSKPKDRVKMAQSNPSELSSESESSGSERSHSEDRDVTAQMPKKLVSRFFSSTVPASPIASNSPPHPTKLHRIPETTNRPESPPWEVDWEAEGLSPLHSEDGNNAVQTVGAAAETSVLAVGLGVRSDARSSLDDDVNPRMDVENHQQRKHRDAVPFLPESSIQTRPETFKSSSSHAKAFSALPVSPFPPRIALHSREGPQSHHLSSKIVSFNIPNASSIYQQHTPDITRPSHRYSPPHLSAQPIIPFPHIPRPINRHFPAPGPMPRSPSTHDFNQELPPSTDYDGPSGWDDIENPWSTPYVASNHNPPHAHPTDLLHPQLEPISWPKPVSHPSFPPASRFPLFPENKGYPSSHARRTATTDEIHVHYDDGDYDLIHSPPRQTSYRTPLTQDYPGPMNHDYLASTYMEHQYYDEQSMANHPSPLASSLPPFSPHVMNDYPFPVSHRVEASTPYSSLSNQHHLSYPPPDDAFHVSHRNTLVQSIDPPEHYDVNINTNLNDIRESNYHDDDNDNYDVTDDTNDYYQYQHHTDMDQVLEGFEEGFAKEPRVDVEYYEDTFEPLPEYPIEMMMMDVNDTEDMEQNQKGDEDEDGSDENDMAEVQALPFRQGRALLFGIKDVGDGAGNDCEDGMNRTREMGVGVKNHHLDPSGFVPDVERSFVRELMGRGVGFWR